MLVSPSSSGTVGLSATQWVRLQLMKFEEIWKFLALMPDNHFKLAGFKGESTYVSPNAATSFLIMCSTNSSPISASKFVTRCFSSNLRASCSNFVEIHVSTYFLEHLLHDHAAYVKAPTKRHVATCSSSGLFLAT